MTKKLKAKHEVFCREFLVDLNATQAAIRAGYASRRAHVTGAELYGKPEIRARINELKQERIDQLGIDANYVLISRTQQITVADKTNMKEGASTSAVQNSGNKTTKPPDTSLLKSITGNVVSLLGGG